MQSGSLNVAPIDLAAIAVLLLFLVRGIVKGFVSQITLMVTVVGGMIAAKWLAPHIEPAVKHWLGNKVSEGSQLDVYLSYFVVFVAFLIVIGIISRLLQRSVTTLNLHSFNRSLGAVAGLALGACFIVIAVLGVSYMGWTQADQALHGTYTARYSYKAVAALTPLFPEDIQERMGPYLRPLENEAQADESAEAKSHPPAKAPAKK
jgi:membrane protein required for colicin V production